MKAFQRQLISSFKALCLEENNLNLDFRTHVFLENQHGGVPSYSYSDAEAVIDCIFKFFDKFHVNYAGRFNRSMSIEALRTTTLKSYLLEHFEGEIDEDIFKAVTAVKAPSYSITHAFVDVDLDNPCLCIDVNPELKEFICARLNISPQGGAGCDGFINVQYPVDVGSQIYLAGGNWTDDIKNYDADELINDIVSDLIAQAQDLVSRSNFELEQIIGTSDVIYHDNLIEHGYYSGLCLIVIEKRESGETYVTFESITQEYKEYFPVPFKRFNTSELALDYIRSHIKNHQTLQDFGISHDIFKEINA